MKRLLLGVLLSVLVLALTIGWVLWRDARHTAECEMAEVHAFAMDACATGKRGVLCILTPADIVELDRSADILKSCAEELNE